MRCLCCFSTSALWALAQDVRGGPTAHVCPCEQKYCQKYCLDISQAVAMEALCRFACSRESYNSCTNICYTINRVRSNLKLNLSSDCVGVQALHKKTPPTVRCREGCMHLSHMEDISLICRVVLFVLFSLWFQVLICRRLQTRMCWNSSLLHNGGVLLEALLKLLSMAIFSKQHRQIQPLLDVDETNP